MHALTNQIADIFSPNDKMIYRTKYNMKIYYIRKVDDKNIHIGFIR